jgi:hypothetical protein
MPFFAMCLQVSVVEPHKKMYPDMKKILHKFSELLKEPSSLPPLREVDHCISLKKVIEPINIRLYR